RDRRAKTPWTRRALAAIARQPGTRAADLATQLQLDTATFKRRIRQLKALGLTISLDTGYQLSPRGEAVLAELSAE
ncbi:MAG: MarR family transcriptional regulator, partial [Myxococcales bacterium]|nr:MarR family transcriptional regulator [Myxococcales bacterium]